VAYPARRRPGRLRAGISREPVTEMIRGSGFALVRSRSLAVVTRAAEELNRRLLRARDAMDRAFAEPLDVPALAKVANLSEAHFIRSFRAAFGETPHRYLRRRRVERSMFLLRETDRSVTDVCFSVGFTSLGTFGRTFREIVGEMPSEYRERHGPMIAPNCFQMATTRPVVPASQAAVPAAPPGPGGESSSFGEAAAAGAS
jgi:transcriptional regulator GlxA family with amidase domain